jgi:hypothetical protein
VDQVLENIAQASAKYCAASWSIVPLALALIVSLIVAATAGCEPNPVTVWSTQASSPDGKWVALARTDRYSGPGNAYISTTVLLRSTTRSTDQAVIEYPDGGFPLYLVWLTPSRLQVRLNKHVDLNLQVVKFANVEIDVRDSATVGGNVAHDHE